MFSQFVGAEMIAEKYQFRREELDAFALDSHRKAARATEAGAFADEIVAARRSPTRTATSRLHDKDEGIRYDATPREHRLGQAAQGRRQDQRRQRQPDLRRRQRRAGGQRSGAEGARPDAAGADPST